MLKHKFRGVNFRMIFQKSNPNELSYTRCTQSYYTWLFETSTHILNGYSGFFFWWFVTGCGVMESIGVGLSYMLLANNFLNKNRRLKFIILFGIIFTPIF